jgi:ubiquinone/menaquinone biosynthesis C-methylase UbiE
VNNATLFASVAREYASFRPGYPAGLFEWLARSCTRRETAWDCGCGSGQASTALAEHFAAVTATDVSAEQIAAARPHPRVRYSIAPAEHSGLPDASVDLVTVAQALHWFDVHAFYAEARRVARPGAVLAVWTYPRPEFVEPELDRVFLDFYSGVVGPYWPPERRHVESHYRTLPFPFDETPHPPFGLELTWSFEQVIGYASSWSATANYRKALHEDPLPLLRQRLREVWPEQAATQSLRMPLVLRAGNLRAR